MKEKKPGIILLITITFLCGFMPLNAQVPFPDFGLAYPQDEVTIIKIIMNPNHLQEMIDNLEDEDHYPATFIFISSNLNDTVHHAGIRLRGNTSLQAQKKSFRISMNTFQQGFKWQGVEKLNLLAQHNDPSLLRSKMCQDAFRYFGVISCRTSFTKLYINEEYRGLYLNQEHIDEEFAKKYFDNEGDGNLYKCTYPASLEYLGSNPDAYKFANWGTRHYELKINEWKDDYSDLVNFISVLNNTSISNLKCVLPQVFNVESYLKVAALDVLLGNWDGYIYNKNNFYLYHDQRTGLINYIPYDLDNTWGIDWVDRNWSDRNIYNWAPSGEDRPLFKRLMQVQEYRHRFSSYINEYCNNYFTQSNIAAIAQGWQNLIADAVQEDNYYELDYGFSYSDFQNSITQAWGGHVDYGIAQFAGLRRASALQQLESYTSVSPVVYWLQHELLVKDANDVTHINALIQGDGAENCNLLISTDGTNWTNTGNEFADDGNVWDTAGDNIYSYFAVNDFGTSKLYYKTSCNSAEFPCEPKWMWTTPSSLGVYINEVMSSNSNTIADEHGEYDDWIELYNSNSWSVNLSGKYLTDDLKNWNKFPLPSISLAPGQFLIIWMDDQPEQGQLHATFKLGSEDHNVWLINMEQGVPRIADHFTPVYGLTNHSFARYPDGGSHIEMTNQPTPGATNGIVSVNETPEFSLCVYPNPAKEMIRWNMMASDATIADASGRIAASCNNCNLMSIAHLTGGVYYLKVDSIVHIILIQH